MEWLTSGWGILAGILGIGFVIAIHELGHYLFAKWAGVRVLEFAIGFGPVVWSKRIGETEYSLHLLPAGGYVAMQEEPTPPEEGQPSAEGSDEGRPRGDGRSFAEASKSWRAAILSGGVLFNLVSSFLILLVLAWAGMPMFPATVGQVEQLVDDSKGQLVDSPGKELGLRPGDTIVRLNGERIYSFEDIIGEVLVSGNEPLEVVIERDGERLTLPPEGERVTPVNSKSRGRPTIGIVPPDSLRIAQVAGPEGVDLRAGDRVVAVAGESTEGLFGQDVRERMAPYVGRQLPLTVERGGQRRELTVPYAGSNPNILLAASLGLPVAITEVHEHLSAAAAGVQVGDIAHAVNGELVRSSEHLHALINRHGAEGAPLRLTLQRRGELGGWAEPYRRWRRLLGLAAAEPVPGWVPLTVTVRLRHDESTGRELIGIQMTAVTAGPMPPLNPALGSESNPLVAAGIEPGDVVLDIDSDGEGAATVRSFEGGRVHRLPLTTAELRALSRYQEVSPLLKFFGMRNPPALARQLTALRIDAIDLEARELRGFDPVAKEAVSVDLGRLDGFADDLRNRLLLELAVGDWVVALSPLSAEGAAALEILRDGSAQPRVSEVDPSQPGVAIVFAPEEQPYRLEAWHQAFGLAADTSLDMLTLTFRVVGRFFKDREEGGIDVSKSLHGPVGIFSELKARADAGLSSLLKFVALLGLNLVIINLLPIPLTDGGRLILLGFEAIMRRPVPERIANLINLIGLVFLVGLMLYVLGLDILRQLDRH